MDIKVIGDQVIAAVKNYVSKAAEAINQRIAGLEEKIGQIPAGPQGERGEKGMTGVRGQDGINGKDADPVEVAAMLMPALLTSAQQAVDALPKPKDGEDGKDADPEQVKALVRQAVDALPKPKDGEDGKDADPEQVKALVKQAVEALPKPKDGEDGKDADPEQVKALVKQAVEALPKPKDGEDGKDADPEQVKALVKQAVEALPKPNDGEDGKDGKSFTIDDAAPVIDNAIIKHLLDFERRATDVLQRAIDRMPEPKAGKDGFSADDLQLEALDGGRTIRVKLMQGEREIVRELPLAIPLDRGVYKSGMKAEAGDGVTYGGSWWIAQRKTDTVPGKSEDWRLAVKRGQDGKDLR